VDAEPTLPFRWSIGDDELGSLLRGVPPADLWFADELLACAAKLLARSADGDLFFVGRSCDSVHDLLSGVLDGTGHAGRLHLLPASFPYRPPPSAAEVRQLRVNLAAAGLAPGALARRRDPVVFADVVASGDTYGRLYDHLRQWIADDGAQWDVIRRKLRFLGVTIRKKTSPHTERWQQDADWTAELPRSSIVNVSLDWRVWKFLAEGQDKTAESFRPDRWLDESARAPIHDDQARRALAEAVALHALGRRRETRGAFVALLAREHAFGEPWLRTLALRIRGR
jgi:hypothetical protein